MRISTGADNLCCIAGSGQNIDNLTFFVLCFAEYQFSSHFDALIFCTNLYCYYFMCSTIFIYMIHCC